jgi:formylglycine-generating enzyme required for sulfatase activity
VAGQRLLSQSPADGGPPSLPDYELLHLAGRGAFGSVWVARDRSGLLLGVKILEPMRFAEPDCGQREERALALVRQRLPHHPHLVSIFHVSRVAGRLLYAMELADPAAAAAPADQPGYRPDTLADRIARGARMPVARAVALALDLLSALEALHDAGLVHRDVKPHNVIFVGGVPKIADIGLAAIVQSQMSLAGTAGYVPLDGSTGPDADLYALGKLLYQTVTGLEPADFPSVPASLLTASEKRSLRRLNRFLLRACAPAKKDRFRSAKEMRPALEAVLRPRRRRRRVVVGMAVAVLLGAMSWWLSLGNKGLEQSKAGSARVAEAHVGPIFFRPGDDAGAAQTECARQRGQPLIQVNSVGMKLILIPPGEFAMGAPPEEEGSAADEFLHEVHISRPFYLGVYEVTQEEYQRVVGHNPSRYLGLRQPVEQVSWDDAVAFCQKLSRQEGVRYRLPTEAEWEYACRAGTTTRTYLGYAVSLSAANIRGGQTLPVGQYAPNPFGLFDLYGNVWEWCADWYSEDYYRHAPRADPQGPTQGEKRILRGAGWFDGPGTREPTDRRVRSASRASREPPNACNNRFGFRVLREIDAGAVSSE